MFPAPNGVTHVRFAPLPEGVRGLVETRAGVTVMVLATGLTLPERIEVALDLIRDAAANDEAPLARVH